MYFLTEHRGELLAEFSLFSFSIFISEAVS